MIVLLHLTLYQNAKTAAVQIPRRVERICEELATGVTAGVTADVFAKTVALS